MRSRISDGGLEFLAWHCSTEGGLLNSWSMHFAGDRGGDLPTGFTLAGVGLRHLCTIYLLHSDVGHVPLRGVADFQAADLDNITRFAGRFADLNFAPLIESRRATGTQEEDN